MKQKLCLVASVFIICLGTTSAIGLENIGTAVNIATRIANIMGGSMSGQVDRGRGCTVYWSFRGQLKGLQWKYIGACIDSCTGIEARSVTESRKGAVEHCITDLLKKVYKKEEL